MARKAKKEKQEKAPDKIRLAGTTRANGKYIFTEEEKRTIGLQLANRQVDKSMIEDEKRSVMSKYKDQLDRTQMDINKMSRHIIDGYEFRDFECHVEIDWAANTKSYIAVDGGMVIAVRALDPSDYQLKLNMEEDEAEKKENPAEEK